MRGKEKMMNGRPISRLYRAQNSSSHGRGGAKMSSLNAMDFRRGRLALASFSSHITWSTLRRRR
jgi:hypothetical protein